MEKRTCPKCGSDNINYQAVTNTVSKNARHGCAWWIFVGWWWIPIKWICFTGIALFMFILKLCGVRKKKDVTVDRTRAVCQNCGHSWNV